jgi:pentatricopeptide repeat protein
VFVKPNVRSYSTVMDAYARLGTSDGCDACLDLLAELEEAHRETGDPAYRPNAVAYNTCLSALARARRPEACWDLFLGMPVDPDIISVNVVLHSVARSGWSDAGDRAQAIMDNFTTAATAAVAANETKTQENLPHDGDASMASPVSSPALRSNARTFSTCMDAWSRCGRPDRALGLLDRLLELHDATGDERYRPNCVPFATVIHAYSVSGDADRTSRAAEVFRRMKERGVPPNAVVLNNLLNCYASRPHPDTAGTVETLYRYISDKHPGWMDSFTFGITLKAVSTCRVVFWRDNPGFAPEVFRECCRRGLVTPVVLWQLRQAVPAETFREILASAPSSAGAERGSSLADVGQIPREWRRHVDERKVLQSRRRRR